MGKQIREGDYVLEKVQQVDDGLVKKEYETVRCHLIRCQTMPAGVVLAS